MWLLSNVTNSKNPLEDRGIELAFPLTYLQCACFEFLHFLHSTSSLICLCLLLFCRDTTGKAFALGPMGECRLAQQLQNVLLAESPDASKEAQAPEG